MSGDFRLMGIVNVTPDSFSDGGAFLDPGSAIAHARELVAAGADILDVGGESTRPGAEPVAAAEELARVLPVLEGLAAVDWASADLLRPRISIDTSKAAVARARRSLRERRIVNDVSALRADPAMVGLLADSGVECCLMHMLGEPRTMQREPHYGDVARRGPGVSRGAAELRSARGRTRGAHHARPRHRIRQDNRP